MSDSFDSEAISGEEISIISDANTESKTQTDVNKEKEIQKNEELIKIISEALTTILECNQDLPDYKKIISLQEKMVFSSTTIPKISIYDYLVRIQNYAYIEKSTLIISLIFIDKLCELAELILTHYNIHRVLFTAISLAIKYNEDTFYDNKYYSEIAGVNLKELKLMEYSFLELTDFNLFVPNETFEKYTEFLDYYKNNKEGSYVKMLSLVEE